MSSEAPLFLVPLSDRPAPQLEGPDDAQKLVPDDWWEDPAAHGILTATSGNYWHVWAMEQIATHFGLPALAFMQGQAAWLAANDLKALDRDLAVLRRAFAAGEVFADPWAVRFEAAPSNRVAFENAIVTLNVEVEDTQENFFAFFKALENRVSHALGQNLRLLYSDTESVDLRLTLLERRPGSAQARTGRARRP